MKEIEDMKCDLFLEEPAKCFDDGMDEDNKCYLCLKLQMHLRQKMGQEILKEIDRLKLVPSALLQVDCIDMKIVKTAVKQVCGIKED